MKVKKILSFVFVFALLFVSCNKSEDLLDGGSPTGDISARPPATAQRHQQREPHSLFLKGTQMAFVKNPVLNDLMTADGHLEFTIETIFKIDEYSEYKRYILSYFNGNEGVIETPRGIQLYLENSKLFFRLNSNVYLLSDEVEKHACNQISITRKENGFMMFYINGHQVANVYDSGDFNTNTSLFIGAKGFRTNSRYTTAITIDEIRLWKYYLDESEINHNLFTNIEPVDYLLGYYNFNNRPLRDSFLDFSEYDSFYFAHQRDGYFYGGANDHSYIHEMECITFREID